MVTKGKTFQEQHKTYFKCALFCSLYPPGIEEIIKSKLILTIFWYMSLAPILLAVPYTIAFIHYLIFNAPDSTVLRIQLFRRALIVIYMGSELATHALRFKSIESLYHNWNHVINKDYCILERKVILERLTKTSTKLLLRFGSIRFLTSTLYNVPLWFNRHMRGSELAGLPHDVNSPYHFYYVGYQTIFFLWFAFAMIAFEFLYCFLLCMAEAELKVLSKKLAEILSALTIADDNKSIERKSPTACEVTVGSREYKEAVERVNHELVRWLKAHQEANKYRVTIRLGLTCVLCVVFFCCYRWFEDLKEFMHLIITIKYMYLGIHCSLVVIGLSGLASRLNELLLILVVTVVNFSFCFYATVQADRLYDNSEGLFLEAYGKGWYLYPVSTQKTLSIIASYAQARPVEFFGFKIYRDNKENFSAVLQTAYQVLTFILPMAES